MKKNRSKNKYLLIFIVFMFLSSLLFYFSNKKDSSKNLSFENIVSVVSSPLQKFFYTTSTGLSSWFKTTFIKNELKEKNIKLQNEINSLRNQLVDFNKYKIQNQELLNLLNIKDSISSLKLKSALVVGRISNDPFKSFIIDKGSNNNIKHKDCVITSQGHVGFVDKVYLTTSVVKTILDKDVAIGIYDINNAESGVLTGTKILANKNMTKMKYLSRQTTVKPDDILITSGVGNNFPKGLLVGKIIDLKQESHDTSYFGLVEPFCDFNNLNHVFVVVSFFNQEINQEINQDIKLGESGLYFGASN
ncbi:MAG: rod shape-determining protein MreC [Oscillospiraceae bacterium]|nr:rod shape-determining protein MreC [Oscillospiraceae bacterium]